MPTSQQGGEIMGGDKKPVRNMGQAFFIFRQMVFI